MHHQNIQNKLEPPCLDYFLCVHVMMIRFWNKIKLYPYLVEKRGNISNLFKRGNLFWSYIWLHCIVWFFGRQCGMQKDSLTRIFLLYFEYESTVYLPASCVARFKRQLGIAAILKFLLRIKQPSLSGIARGTLQPNFQNKKMLLCLSLPVQRTETSSKPIFMEHCADLGHKRKADNLKSTQLQVDLNSNSSF